MSLFCSKYSDVRHIAIQAGIIQAVSHHEAIFYLKAPVSNRNIYNAARWLVQKDTYGQARRVPRLKRLCKVPERKAGIHDILDDKDVPSNDGVSQILNDTHFPRASRRLSIRRHSNEIQFHWNRNATDQIGQKDRSARKHTDQHWGFAGIILGNSRAESLDTLTDRLRIEQDFHWSPTLFPLDRGRRFGAYVVRNAVDARDLIYDAAADRLK